MKNISTTQVLGLRHGPASLAIGPGHPLKPGTFAAWRRALSGTTDAPILGQRLAPVVDALDAVGGADHHHLEAACAGLGITVCSASLRGHGGLATERLGHRRILVDSGFAPMARAFVVAHELCHLLLAPARLAGLAVQAEEELCDYFASALVGSSRSVLSA